MPDCGSLLKRKPAAARVGRNPRWLDLAPIPRYDMRLVGARRADWMWCEQDIAAFIESRRVDPGHASPFE